MQKLQQIQTEETKRYVGGFWRRGEVGEDGRFAKGHRDLGFLHAFTMLTGVRFHRLLSPQSSFKPSASQCDLILETVTAEALS